MSQTVNLVGNRRYYIEALHKEGIGRDHLAVGWKLPDGTLERPIPGMRLIPFRDQSCPGAGKILREQWNGIPGTLISSIPTDTDPASIEAITLFESPSNIGDNYGARIRGSLCVPVSGNYTFWIASNDKSELWLSSDANPANKKRIAHVPYYTSERQWRKFAEQKSQTVYLEHGQNYYIEALHKEGIGDDHVSVGWQLPDGTLERPIPGMRLVPYEDLGIAPRVNIVSPGNGQTFPARSRIEMTAEATDEDGVVKKVEFYVGTQKVAEDATAPYNATWSTVEEGTYWLSARAIDDRGLSSARSAPVHIIVEPACRASGSITREWWKGIPGNYVSSIPLTTAPQGSESLAIFEAPSNLGSNYGARIRGYICPPASGEYYFWISSNDHSELWLSADDREGNKQIIASVTGATDARQWDKFRSQKSVAIGLTRGKTYYIEALHKQGVGTDHLAVGWQLPDGTLERPIAGSHLTPVHAQAATASSPASVEGDEKISVDVFPNPVHGEKLSIIIDNHSGEENATGEITIRQITGMSVYNERIRCDNGCRTEIDVEKHLTPGLYILQVKSGGKIFTEKLIVP